MRAWTLAAAITLALGLACGGIETAPPPSGTPTVGGPDDGGGGGGRRGKRRGGGGGGGGGGGAPAPPSGGGDIYCEATGIYTVCTDQGNGFEQCNDQYATGGGAGTSQAQASQDALVSCETHMLNMVIIGNMPGGGHASIKQSCVVTGCR